MPYFSIVKITSYLLCKCGIYYIISRNKVVFIVVLSKSFTYMSNFDLERTFLTNTSTKMGNKSLMIFLLLCMSNLLFAQQKKLILKIDSINNIKYEDKIENTTKSVKWFNEALLNSQKINYKKGIADSYANLGLVYYYQGKYDLNTDAMIKAARIYESLKMNSKLAQTWAEYGYQLKRKNMPLAIKYMLKAIKLSEKKNDKKSLCGMYDNYGVLKEMKGELDSALIFYNKSLKLKTELKDSFGMPYSINNIAGVKLMQNKTDEAKKYFDWAYNIRKSIKDVYGISESLNLYGNYYKKIGNLDLALQYYEQCAYWSMKNKFPLISQENQKQISEIYESKNDYKNALSAYKNYDFIKDSILNFDIRNRQAELDTEYDTEQKEKQILVQRAELAEKNLWILGGFFIALLAIIIGFFVYNRQKQKTQQLQKENELKDALLVIETQNRLQEQRLRISRDLHDNIGSQLTFIISSIDNLKYGYSIENQKLVEKLNSISSFTRETISELRDTIWALNKDEISFEDLKIRISNFIDKAKIASSGIHFGFDCEGNFENIKLSSLQGINIYRIIQEAINNSLKHANPKEILVKVKQNGSEFLVTINDDGKGFDQNDENLGNGLNNLSKRAKELKGDVKIKSALGEGTRVVLTFKIE